MTEISVEVSVEFVVKCGNCGNELHPSCYRPKESPLIIEIDPCPTCFGEKDQLIDELESKIAELE